MTTAVKRACDACHRRKVKCDGVNPCRNCSSAQLGCTYNAIPQKKGPKGSRAKVISELRETQRQTSLTSKQNRVGAVGPAPCSSLVPTPGVMSAEMVKSCIDFFFDNMYSKMPILHRPRLEQQAMYMDQNLETYCLLSSLCAFMMLQPGMSIPGSDMFSYEAMPGSNLVSGTMLMEETVRVRKSYDYLDSPSHNSLCTSYFLFGCYYALDMHDKAWYHLREATTLVHMIGMNKEETFSQYDAIEGSRRRRLYWLLFVTERAYALQRQRPLSLQSTINEPTLTDDPSDPLAHTLNPFILLVNLFRPFDDTFTALWNKTRADAAPTYLSALQKQFGEVLPAHVNVADSSLNDLHPSQQWLKNQIWQLGIASSNNGDPNMQLPVDAQRELVSMASHFSSDGIGLLGFRLVEKLFELSCSLSEVLYMQPASRDPLTIGPREHLKHLLHILTVLRNGDHRFLPLLLGKVNDVLPRLCNPMLQNVPENAANIDIFDGFGNAGMAQPPVSFDEYETKYPVNSRLDENSNESGSSSGASHPNPSDISSPFVNSPSVVSPVNEYGQSIPPEFGSMGEMVMTPLGPGPNTPFNGAPPLNTSQPQHQHQQMHSISGLPILSLPNPPANFTLASQSTSMPPSSDPNQTLKSQHPTASLCSNGPSIPPPASRPGPMSRANSFAVPSQQIRTIGDFHALQRASSDMSSLGQLGMPGAMQGAMQGSLQQGSLPINTKLDFNTLR